MFLYDRGLVIPKVADCGAHEWYNARDGVAGCYHCRVIRPASVVSNRRTARTTVVGQFQDVGRPRAGMRTIPPLSR